MAGLSGEPPEKGSVQPGPASEPVGVGGLAQVPVQSQGRVADRTGPDLARIGCQDAVAPHVVMAGDHAARSACAHPGGRRCWARSGARALCAVILATVLA